MKTAAVCVVCALGAFFAMYLSLSGQFGDPDNLSGDKDEVKKIVPPAKFPSALAAATRGQSVPQAAAFLKTAETHGVVVMTRKGLLHEWHERLQPDWQADSVETTELVLVVGTQRQTQLQVVTYANGAPPITRYRYDLDVWLVEARTGQTIKSNHFTTIARQVRPRELWELTELGEEVSWATVATWMREVVAVHGQELLATQ
jgi:hypothetical protein